MWVETVLSAGPQIVLKRVLVSSVLCFVERRSKQRMRISILFRAVANIMCEQVSACQFRIATGIVASIEGVPEDGLGSIAIGARIQEKPRIDGGVPNECS